MSTTDNGLLHSADGHKEDSSPGFLPAAGPRATFTGNPATIAGGQASVTATANNVAGPYDVAANASGAAAAVNFSLTNTTVTNTPPSFSV